MLTTNRYSPQVFLGDQFPWWFSAGGYAALATLGTIVIPFLYPQVSSDSCATSAFSCFHAPSLVSHPLPNPYPDPADALYASLVAQIKWYMVLVAYLLAILLALPNAYGDGLTDWDMASMYGKLAILLFAAWGGGWCWRQRYYFGKLWLSSNNQVYE